MNYEEMRNLLKDKGIILSDEIIQKFNEYFHLLVTWNEKFNLTSITNEEDVIEKHFYDCLIASDPTLLTKGKQVADLGSGAGFPGLVWAIVYGDVSFTLIEATKKKCTFLEEASKALGLKNVKVVNARVEELPPSFKESFDFVTARAVAELRILLELGVPFLKIGGTFIAMKGSHGNDELKNAANAIKSLSITNIDTRLLSLPNSDGERTIILLKKGKKTERKYPRKYADILKKPL